MKTSSVLAGLLLLATAVAVTPSAQAAEMPPPCQTMTTCCGIEPAFAPCCSVLTCPPPVVHCPAVRLHTSDFLAYAGPHFSIDVYGDCSASACMDQTGFCCTADGTMSNCGALACTPPGLAPETFAMALPVRVDVHDDCSATVTETMACPYGWQKSRFYRDTGQVALQADFCSPVFECTCPPMETMAAEEPPAMADPFPTCVRECAPVPTDGCELQQATPATVGPLATVNPRALVWGSNGDCDVDVEPIGACAPPSGKMVEKRIGPVHLRLLLCGGDPPDWS